MDKILLTVFLSALAGFITAILSIVKLVNEKESKTTEYRQAWTDSVRRSLAELIGLINAQAANIASKAEIAQMLNELEGQKDQKRDIYNHYKDSLAEALTITRETRREIYEKYSHARLHFKPNDLSFNRIEQKFDILITLFKELQNAKENERNAIKEKVHAIADEITGFSRDILKTEWETVKSGEPAYKTTKKWAVITSIITLFILISIGIHGAISIWKHNIYQEKTDSAAVSPANSHSK